MQILQKLGLGLFISTLLLFVLTLSMSNYQLTESVLQEVVTDENHYAVLAPELASMLDQEYSSKFSFIADFKGVYNGINENFKANGEWDKVIWTDYTFNIVKKSSTGFVTDNVGLLFLLCFVVSSIGALLYIVPQINEGPPGIKNNNIFLHAATNRGWIGITVGTALIVFYIFLYKFPEFITNWVLLLDPLSVALSGNEASQWFLYGVMYCLAMTVMGVRMAIKYRHNKYQLIRTGSVVFFQVAFAFTLPQIMSRLHLPSYDLKSAWPLEYTFFFDYRLDEHIQQGTLGVWMLAWGILLFAVGVPVMTYFFGKRWYCSWVCGCGGLAETLGDPYRHLSDKSVKAWKVERWMIHSVLVFAILMTGSVIYAYISGSTEILGLSTYSIRDNYGFFIGFAFAGVVGTGFYPLMGNRMWCRFGCPLAAYLGFVQRFKSRFRITTNGGQCISCGNCSTYCEMGIDVRWYAQRGQNIVRSSCVGCGICSAVCPRGVLKLENAPNDDASRMDAPAIIIGNEGLKLREQVEEVG